MKTVLKALVSVQKDLAAVGIAKSDQNTYDNYKFRGIDAVMNTLAPILSNHGVVIIPSVTSSEIRTVPTAKGGTQNHAKVTVDYTLYDAEGDSITHSFVGEGMDRGDKSINKACTAAYKYFLFEAFCIPVEGTADADSESPEIGAEQVPDPMQAHLEAVANNMASNQYIKDCLSRDEYESAYEAFQEIDPETHKLLWMAPTKGGKAWTTKEIAQMKSNEWGAARKAFNGLEESAA
jgi:hypothetical protein